MFSLPNVWGSLPSLFITRSISCSSSCNSRNHYMTLGITPAASQEDIKRAYFELCKKYHPDKTDGSVESTKMFRLITEAYEVLGEYRYQRNEKLRRAYDERMRYGAGIRIDNLNVKRKEGYQYNAEKVFHDRMNPRKVYTGKTWQFDYDAWTRAHYPLHGKTKEEDLKMKADRRRNWRSFDSSESPEFKRFKTRQLIIIRVLLISAFCIAISVVPFETHIIGISVPSEVLKDNKDNKRTKY